MEFRKFYWCWILLWGSVDGRGVKVECVNGICVLVGSLEVGVDEFFYFVN